MSRGFIAIMSSLLFLVFLHLSPVCVSVHSASGGDGLSIGPNATVLEGAETELPKRLPANVLPEGDHSSADQIDEPADDPGGTQVPMPPQPPSDRGSNAEQWTE